jgi:hypothetical protein
MRQRSTHVGLGVLLILWCAASTPAQTPAVTSQDVFVRIQEAWQNGNAGSITRHFGERRASIGLPEVEPVGGHFSRSQSYYILKMHFETTQVQEFEFEHVRDPEQDGRVALGLARRRYRQLGDGRIIQDRVLVVLEQERGRWVISEIRALR